MTATEIVKFVSGLSEAEKADFANAVKGGRVEGEEITLAASAFNGLPFGLQQGVGAVLKQDYSLDLSVGDVEPEQTTISEGLEIVPAEKPTPIPTVKEAVKETVKEPLPKKKAGRKSAAKK
jgi:hypothetical protein